MTAASGTATEIATGVRNGRISPTAMVEAVLERIEHRNEINAFVEVAEDSARRRAEEIEAAVAAGRSVGPLAGVPVAIKESVASKAGLSQTRGCVPFRSSVAESDSTIVTRLEAAGAIIVGTTNTPELDHKGTTDNPLCGPTRNPFDLSRNAGGSSGGSAAAVAAGIVPLAHGKDAGGSLRIPAAWSGVYAIKPTFGRLPTVTRPDGFANELGIRSSHGPITRSVRDAALFLDVLGEHHPRDPSSVPAGTTQLRAAVDRSIDGLSVGYLPTAGGFPVEATVRATVDGAVEVFERAGAEVTRTELEIGYSHTELTETWLALVGANLGAYAQWLADEHGLDLLGSHRAELTDSLVSLIESGSDMAASTYLHHHVVRTAVHDAFEACFETYDVLVGPTVCCLAVENATAGSTLGPTAIDGEPVDPRIGWAPTLLTNFTGHPSASIPAGTVDGLPVGLQLIGPRFADDLVVAASGAFERLRSYPTP